MRNFIRQTVQLFVDMAKAVFWFAVFVSLYVFIGNFVASDPGTVTPAHAIAVALWPLTVAADLVALCWLFVKITVASLCALYVAVIAIGTFLLLTGGK